MSQVTKSTQGSRLPSQVRKIGAAIALSFGLIASAGATTINTGLVGGVFNTLEDLDREAYFDIDNSGTISVGDVLVGYVRIDKFQTSTTSVQGNNETYGIISNQIISSKSGGSIIELGVTTQIGLRLEDITGDANTTGGLIAVYDKVGGFGDLIASPVGADMEDNTDAIALGTLRLTLGLSAADLDDFLTVTITPGLPGGVGSSNAFLADVPGLGTFANFTGGLSVLYNKTNFNYLGDNQSFDPYAGVLAYNQVAVLNGGLRTAGANARPDIWQDGSGYGGFTQCLVPNSTGGFISVRCGPATDADFQVHPEAIPEPGTISLLGAGLVGLVGLRRRLTKA